MSNKTSAKEKEPTMSDLYALVSGMNKRIEAVEASSMRTEAQKAQEQEAEAKAKALKQVEQVDPATAAANRSKLAVQKAKTLTAAPAQTAAPAPTLKLEKKQKMNAGRGVYETEQKVQEKPKEENGRKFSEKKELWYAHTETTELAKGLYYRKMNWYETSTSEEILESVHTVITSFHPYRAALYTDEQLRALIEAFSSE